MEKVMMLKGVIETYQNDFDCGYEGEDKESIRPIILNLIVELSRYTNGLRYCSKKDCSCSPERKIKQILNKHEKELDRVLFLPLSLCSINMLKVKRTLKNI
ncbi:hypothetical protein J14TS2_16300 [Bacillus sp. J14TS2]|nr:hypothetical protein J14TS2_16300 [Bacillus sp. J14TS2]